MTRPRTHAFTTIELLITLSILVILAGLVFVGFKVVGNGGKTRATRNTLETAKSLLTEVDVAKGLPYIKRIYTSPPNGATAYPNTFPPVDKTKTPAYPNALPAPVDTSASKNGVMDDDAFNASTHSIRYTDTLVIRTQMVMARVQSISANRTTVGQLPSKGFLGWPVGVNPSTVFPAPTVGNALQFQLSQAGPPAKYTLSPPVLVDAWSNPIIYVPAAGMSGVYFKDDSNNYTNKVPATEHVITSVRVRAPYKAGDGFEPGATGFWASAGADGDFTKGDDNIYSFEGF